jgi:hypothetical protein
MVKSASTLAAYVRYRGDATISDRSQCGQRTKLPRTP